MEEYEKHRHILKEEHSNLNIISSKFNYELLINFHPYRAHKNRNEFGTGILLLVRFRFYRSDCVKIRMRSKHKFRRYMLKNYPDSCPQSRYNRFIKQNKMRRSYCYHYTRHSVVLKS